MKIQNAVPKIFYGLHFQDGVAEYKESDPPSMIYVSSDTAKKMDRTYQGKPLYVMHNSDAKHDNVQEADGVVVRSFYNQFDGNHWSEFLVYTDEGFNAIKRGWTLSNAYMIRDKRGSGIWHGVEYDYEVADAEYDHLAIVPNPRYSDSIILTPEDFKQYNLDKEAELTRLSNSKGESKMFKLFKKEKVENSTDFENMSVQLPKSKVEKTLAQLVNEADKKEEAKGMANMDDKVKVNDDEMSVKELLNKYNKLVKRNEEAEKEKENEDDEKENMDEDEKKNEEEKEKENKKNEDEDDEGADEKENKKKNSLESENAKLKKELADMKKNNFEMLANAPWKADEPEVTTIETSTDLVSRGKSRYGSK